MESTQKPRYFGCTRWYLRRNGRFSNHHIAPLVPYIDQRRIICVCVRFYTTVGFYISLLVCSQFYIEYVVYSLSYKVYVVYSQSYIVYVVYCQSYKA